ncbi:hypothetical protein BaRGS_00001325 [Batillaria attramentaria]|uniref:Uncharacterized protein n=1 Tax=Batillaria attramentaria TaxID=370345 RepID=A0ABD0M7C2_9CAEN
MRTVQQRKKGAQALNTGFSYCHTSAWRQSSVSGIVLCKQLDGLSGIVYVSDVHGAPTETKGPISFRPRRRMLHLNCTKLAVSRRRGFQSEMPENTALSSLLSLLPALPYCTCSFLQLSLGPYSVPVAE